MQFLCLFECACLTARSTQIGLIVPGCPGGRPGQEIKYNEQGNEFYLHNYRSGRGQIRESPNNNWLLCTARTLVEERHQVYS